MLPVAGLALLLGRLRVSLGRLAVRCGGCGMCVLAMGVARCVIARFMLLRGCFVVGGRFGVVLRCFVMRFVCHVVFLFWEHQLRTD